MSDSYKPDFKLVSKPPFPVGSIIENLDNGLKYRVEGYSENILGPYIIVMDESLIKYQWRVDYE